MERPDPDCRREASLDELLADPIMQPVLRSARRDARQLRDLLAATARRIEELDAGSGNNDPSLAEHQAWTS